MRGVERLLWGSCSAVNTRAGFASGFLQRGSKQSPSLIQPKTSPLSIISTHSSNLPNPSVDLPPRPFFKQNAGGLCTQRSRVENQRIRGFRAGRGLVCFLWSESCLLSTSRARDKARPSRPFARAIYMLSGKALIAAAFCLSAVLSVRLYSPLHWLMHPTSPSPPPPRQGWQTSTM